LTPELKRIQEMLKKQLNMLRNWVTVRYLALDGHFGNNNALEHGPTVRSASDLQAAL